MGKFNISTTQGGMLTDLEQAAHADLPVTSDPAPEPAQQQGGAIEALMSQPEQPPVAAGSPETAPTQEEVGLAAETEQDRQRVPTIQERSKQQVTPVKWNAKGGQPTLASSDGGIADRARNMVNQFGENNAWTGGLGISPAQDAGGLSAVMKRVGAVADQSKVEKPDGGLGFNTQLDPNFLMIGSVVTENVITRLAAGQTPTVSFQQEKIQDFDEETAQATKNVFGKVTGNLQLGQEINREYKRFQNAQEGRPTDEYTDLSPEEATLLGDAFKEMYAIANPNDLKRVAPELGGYVTFQLTPEGDARLNSPEAKHKRSVMFPGVNVRPAKSPPPKGRLQGEAGRVATRSQSGKVKGTPAGREVIDEAAQNLSSVPNVVDTQRLKILLSTILPVLAGRQDVPLAYGTINNIGEKQIQKFNAAKKAADRDNKEYDVEQNFEDLMNTTAQAVRSIVMERKGANFLTYYVQNFNGRISPQQSFFDPTTSKAVRFVTRNAVPAKATPGSRVERNLRQMYAMMLVKGADALLPEGREQALTRDTAKLQRWGERLSDVLDASISDAQLEAISEAIVEGKSLNADDFPQFNALALDPSADAELLAAIESKGEDGPHFIDGLIDFAKYTKAREYGKPYHSYFNAYMDGKTNGIASNGIQMGSREVAFKTGVLRTNPETLLDEDMDIRDALMKSLTEELDTTGMAGTDPNLYAVARSVYNYRQLAKDTTMTFGYGKELESFRQDISDALDLLAEDPASPVGPAMEALMVDGDRESIVDTLWTQYTNHLAGALSEEAIDSRPLMRAAAVYHAIMDRVMTLKTATGMDLHLGGEVAENALAESYKEQTYEVRNPDGTKRKVTSQQFGTRSTAAAAKGDQGLGSRAYGGSLPGPVQSLDAAAVALTASGKSWDRLKENSSGSPYLHTIYDAFKVDAMGYDVVLEEVNKNWLDASMEWSYLQATLDATAEASKEFNEQLKQLPDSLPIDATPTGEYAMFGYLTAETENSRGNMGPWNLVRILDKTLKRPVNMTEEEAKKWYGDLTNKAKTIMGRLKKQGFNADSPTVQDLRSFLQMYNAEVNLRSRLNGMIQHTDAKKKKLKQEIRDRGVPVYQYYAH